MESEKMPLFEVAIIEKPTRKEIENGAVEKLVFGPEAVIAVTEQAAAITAVMDSVETKNIDRNKMEVLIRPFA
jgi:hypothetical protein